MRNKKNFGIYQPEDLECGDIAIIDDKFYFIFQNLKGKTGKTGHITALPIQKKHPNTVINDKEHLVLSKNQTTAIGLEKGTQFYISLQLDAFPKEGQSLPQNITVLAQTRTAHGQQKALYTTVVRAADEYMQRQQMPELFARPDPATIKVDTVTTPEWLRKTRKSGKGKTIDISLKDAVDKGFLDGATYQILKDATFERGKKVETLQQAFNIVRDNSNHSQHDLEKLLESGLSHSRMTLKQAFEAGYLNEETTTRVFNTKSRGFDTIIAAQRAIREDHPSLRNVNEAWIDDMENQPMRALKNAIKSAHKKFIDAHLR